MKQLDYGFKQSDKMLGELEQRLHKEYTQAAAEMEEKANKYFQRFQKEDAKKADAYLKGEITKKEYAEWRQRKMLTGKRWADMKETLARHAVNTDKIAMSFVSDKIKDVYALNMNFGTYDIERVSGINTAFTLINQDAIKVLLKDNPQLLPSPKVDIPKDMRWNMQHINSAITQGIMQGESIPKVAKRLQAVTGMDERAAIRNARTAMTGAQNAGRFDAIKRMNERGVVVKKVWIATLDNVTRDSHVDLDGEVVDYDQTFSNGLMYPADGTGAPEEVYNCRCRLGKEYDKYRTDWSDMRNRRDDKIKDMGYEEWKKQARDRLEMKGKVTKKESQKVAIKNTLIAPVRPRKEDFATDDEYREARQKFRAENDIYKQKREELVEQWESGEREYNTANDVKAWAESRGVKLGGDVENNVDARLFDEVLGTLDEMFEKYPETKEQFIHGFELYYENDLNYLAKANGGLGLSGYFSRADSVYTDVIEGQATGFETRGDGTLKTIIRHEYGHNADWYCRSKFSTIDSTYEWKVSGKLDRRYEAARQYERELVDLTLKHGSEYSHTNTLEAFAEGFAEYTSNPDSEYGKAFGEFFERWYYAHPVE